MLVGYINLEIEVLKTAFKNVYNISSNRDSVNQQREKRMDEKIEMQISSFTNRDKIV
jgi:hypothetical protein